LSSLLYVLIITTITILILGISIASFPEAQSQRDTTSTRNLSTSNSAVGNPTINSAAHESNSTNNSTANMIKENSTNKITTGSMKQSTSSSTSTSTSTSPSNYNSKAEPLSISIQSSHNIVNGKGTSTMSAIAYDATTGKKIDNAIIRLKIVFTSNGTTKEVIGRNGHVTYSVELNPNTQNNSSYNATVVASAPGYIPTTKTTTSSTASTSITTSSLKVG